MKFITSFPSMLVSLCLLAGLLSSCAGTYFYQVYDVASSSLKKNPIDGALYFENADLKIYYNFWSNGGNVGFVVVNKTDRNLFLDMNQSFFICNGQVNDYFSDREFTSSSTISTGAQISGSRSGWTKRNVFSLDYTVPTTASKSASQAVSKTSAVTWREKPVLCVPASSYRYICMFSISPSRKFACKSSIDYPFKTELVAEYKEADSDITFENRIAYSFDSGLASVSHVSNKFYVSRINNYSTRSASTNYYGDCSKKKYRRFLISSPVRFYNSYVKGK